MSFSHTKEFILEFTSFAFTNNTVIELIMFFILAKIAIRYGEKVGMRTGLYYL
jgi:hypothetical protein